MKDDDCVQFLQDVLPKLGLRWPGFRKVRRQVCRRVNRRMDALGLSQLWAYREYLDQHLSEWELLDEMCRISISRFYRDIHVFDLLRTDVLPQLAEQAQERGDPLVRVWSAGCASGEEPYTVKMIWEIDLKHNLNSPLLHITATDADAHMLERARCGCYPKSSVKDFPAEWLGAAFHVQDGEYCVQHEFRTGIDLVCQDIRKEQPEGPFDLILCRHLVFTYFDEYLQREMAKKIITKLRSGGFLVTGKQEQFPHPTGLGLKLYYPRSGVYRRSLGAP